MSATRAARRSITSTSISSAAGALGPKASRVDTAAVETLCRRLRDAVERLPTGLRDHVFRVEHESVRLAGEHAVDIGLARIAALGHDLARAEPDERLIAMALEYGLVPDEVEKAEPILIHGPIATRILAREYKLDYGEILAGIAAHTTARPGMTPLEKV